MTLQTFLTLTPARWRVLLTLIVLLTLGRIATTHRVFSQTFDEPYHLISGYDVLTKGSYTADPQHPPLARVLFALPFLDAPDPAGSDALTRGNELLLRNERYTQNVARARLGNLPFVALGIVMVALWGRRVLGPGAGLLAALLFASLPPVLAHGGLATTDMSIAATLPLALFALDVLLERPTWRNALWLGLAIAAGLLSKYSFLIYFPACAGVLFAVRRRFPLLRLATATAIAALLTWGAYSFTFDTMQHVDGRAREMAKEVTGSEWIADVPLPAPVFFSGALEVKRHDLRGHKGYLFGQFSETGWWYYFPVAIFFKTPIAFLLLALIGVALLARRAPEVALTALAILLVAMTSRINIGVRHVLPIYAPLSIAAAAAVVTLQRLRWMNVALVAWLVAGLAFAHPDYLPWMNAFAGEHPEQVLNDSNFDWGEDALRLARVARKERIPHITTSLLGTTPLDHIGLPPRSELQAMQPAHGWVAISEMHLALGRSISPEVARWLDQLFAGRPYRRVGKTIRLYKLP